VQSNPGVPMICDPASLMIAIYSHLYFDDQSLSPRALECARDYDVLLCPSFSSAALPHRQDGAPFERRISIEGKDIDYSDLLFWPGLTGGYHLPATVAPMGITKAGLPLGVQIAGPIYGDRTTLAAAALLEEAGLSFKPPPGW